MKDAWCNTCKWYNSKIISLPGKGSDSSKVAPILTVILFSKGGLSTSSVTLDPIPVMTTSFPPFGIVLPMDLTTVRLLLQQKWRWYWSPQRRGQGERHTSQAWWAQEQIISSLVGLVDDSSRVLCTLTLLMNMSIEKLWTLALHANAHCIHQTTSLS